MPAAADWFACGTTLFGLFTGLQAFPVCNILARVPGCAVLVAPIPSHPIPYYG
jgi:hypothetical protein